MAAGFSGVSGVVNITLARYDSSGLLDTTFGSLGIQATPIGPSKYTSSANAYGVAIQSGGKIVAVGSAEGRFVLTRYTSNGVLDTTFGSAGVRTTTVGTGAVANGVAIQKNGKIVVAGVANNSFALARYNSSGFLDLDFFSGASQPGTVITHIDNSAGTSAVAIQSDGKIVVAGYASNSTSQVFAVARYTGDNSIVTPTISPAWIVVTASIVLIAGMTAIIKSSRRVSSHINFD